MITIDLLITYRRYNSGNFV